MVEAAIVVLILLALLTAVPAGRAVARRRASRRAEWLDDRVRYFEDRIRGEAERMARERGITVDEALAYYRAGLFDTLRAQARVRRCAPTSPKGGASTWTSSPPLASRWSPSPTPPGAGTAGTSSPLTGRSSRRSSSGWSASFAKRHDRGLPCTASRVPALPRDG